MTGGSTSLALLVVLLAYSIVLALCVTSVFVVLIDKLIGCPVRISGRILLAGLLAQLVGGLVSIVASVNERPFVTWVPANPLISGTMVNIGTTVLLRSLSSFRRRSDHQ